MSIHVNLFLPTFTDLLEKLFPLFYTLNNFNQLLSINKKLKKLISTSFNSILPILTYFFYLPTRIYQRK